MRLVFSIVVGILVLAVVEILRRRHARLNGPTLVHDLDVWNKSMPLAKPRQIYTGTQPVDRKALARALKGQKPKAKTTSRRLRVVPDVRRIG